MNLKIRSIRKLPGFTVIELVAVVAIIAVLMVALMTAYGQMQANQRLASTTNKLVSSLYLAKNLAISNDRVHGFRVITNMSPPTYPGDPGFPVQYIAVWGNSRVDEYQVPRDVKVSTAGTVRAVADTNVTRSAPGDTIDGVILTPGDRVLLTGQTSRIENGLWIFNGPGNPLQRPPDYPSASGNTPSVMVEQDFTVYVHEGLMYPDTLWRCQTAGGILVDQTETSWTQKFSETYLHNADAAALGNIDISQPPSRLDGVTLVAGQSFILLLAQNDDTQNGPWLYNGTTSQLTRDPSWNTFQKGQEVTVFVTQGGQAGGTLWRCGFADNYPSPIATNDWKQAQFTLPFNADGTSAAGQKVSLTLSEANHERVVEVFYGGMIRISRTQGK